MIGDERISQAAVTQRGQAGFDARSLTTRPAHHLNTRLEQPMKSSLAQPESASSPVALGSHLPATCAARQLIALSKAELLGSVRVLHSRALRERLEKERGPRMASSRPCSGGSGRFKMQSTSEGSRALGRMRAFIGVELRLSGAGEIGISFLGRACVCACGG